MYRSEMWLQSKLGFGGECEKFAECMGIRYLFQNEKPVAPLFVLSETIG